MRERKRHNHHVSVIGLAKDGLLYDDRFNKTNPDCGVGELCVEFCMSE